MTKQNLMLFAEVCWLSLDCVKDDPAALSKTVFTAAGARRMHTWRHRHHTRIKALQEIQGFIRGDAWQWDEKALSEDLVTGYAGRQALINAALVAESLALDGRSVRGATP